MCPHVLCTQFFLFWVRRDLIASRGLKRRPLLVAGWQAPVAGCHLPWSVRCKVSGTLRTFCSSRSICQRSVFFCSFSSQAWRESFFLKKCSTCMSWYSDIAIYSCCSLLFFVTADFHKHNVGVKKGGVLQVPKFHPKIMKQKISLLCKFSVRIMENKCSLGGGFKHFSFKPLPGEMVQFD